eukprot:31195-Pelagococcus_subviridis.AAC.7
MTSYRSGHSLFPTRMSSFGPLYDASFSCDSGSSFSIAPNDATEPRLLSGVDGVRSARSFAAALASALAAAAAMSSAERSPAARIAFSWNFLPAGSAVIRPSPETGETHADTTSAPPGGTSAGSYAMRSVVSDAVSSASVAIAFVGSGRVRCGAMRDALPAAGDDAGTRRRGRAGMARRRFEAAAQIDLGAGTSGGESPARGVDLIGGFSLKSTDAAIAAFKRQILPFNHRSTNSSIFRVELSNARRDRLSSSAARRRDHGLFCIVSHFESSTVRIESHVASPSATTARPTTTSPSPHRVLMNMSNASPPPSPSPWPRAFSRSKWRTCVAPANVATRAFASGGVATFDALPETLDTEAFPAAGTSVHVPRPHGVLNLPSVSNANGVMPAQDQFECFAMKTPIALAFISAAVNVDAAAAFAPAAHSRASRAAFSASSAASPFDLTPTPSLHAFIPATSPSR